MSAPPNTAELTRLLHDWQGGNPEASEELWPIVYDELKRLAHHIVSDRHGKSPLATTTLVHELYLRLLGGENLAWNDRGHFFAVAARAMRFILVDGARRRQTAKRGGDVAFVPLDEAVILPAEPDTDLVALDDALHALELIDSRKSLIVELSYFAGLTYGDIGKALEISPATVKRDLRSAKLWLLHQLRRDAAGPEGAGRPA